MTSGLSPSYAQLGTPHCRKVVFTIISLAIIVFSIYGNSFDCSWHFDDEHTITINPNIHLKDISWKNIKKTFFSDQCNPNAIYRPVSCLSFALNYYWGRLDVFGFHLINVFIHFFTSIFLFLFIYNTLNLPSLRSKYAQDSYFIALLATVLWTINPIQTQALTYIVQRMASMAGMFYIMSMYFYVKARTADIKLIKILFFMLCFSCFILALGSKENAAMLPLSIFVFDFLILQENSREKAKKKPDGISSSCTCNPFAWPCILLFQKGQHIFIFRRL